MTQRKYTVIAGLNDEDGDSTQLVALIHVSAEDLTCAHEEAKITLAKNVDDGSSNAADWEVLYTFTGVLEPEEYFLEETEDVRQLDGGHRDPGHESGQQGGDSFGRDGEI